MLLTASTPSYCMQWMMVKLKVLPVDIDTHQVFDVFRTEKRFQLNRHCFVTLFFYLEQATHL